MPIVAAYGSDVQTFGVIKRGNFLQTDAVTAIADPAGSFEIVLFVETLDITAINFAIVNPPSGTPIPLSDANNFTFTDKRASQAELNSAYGSGSYTFTIDTANDDINIALLSVPADAYGPTPLISSFPALQSVDFAKSFQVSWQPFAGGTAADSIQLRILDETDFPIFDTSAFGIALDGTATSVSIEEGFLEPGKSYKGIVTFSKSAGIDTTAYPGAAGTVSFAKQTQFPIKTTVGGNVGGPGLLFANPADGATDVPVGSPIVFLFTTPMQPNQSIAWNGNNVNPANFQYSWPQPDTLLITYNGGLPGNSTITYTLNGFKDTAGIAMPPVSGSFTTGAGSVNPNCPPPDDTKGGLSVFKSLSYSQTGPGAPVLQSGDEANISFVASLQSPTVNPVVSATLRTPTGQTVTLPNTFGRLFSFFKSFPTQAALEGEFPSGAYVATITRQSGTPQTLNLAMQAEPPVPHIANWAEANALNSGVDSPLRWNLFAGVAPNDSIFLNLTDQAGHTFSAPDPCVPRQLANTATSIVLPKNTLSPAGDIDGFLTFSKAGSQDTSLADLSGFAGYSKMTTFKLRAGSTPGTGLRFNQPVPLANGLLQVAVTGEVSASYLVESSTDLKNWTTFSTLKLSASGTGELTVPRTGPHLFLRGRSVQ